MAIALSLGILREEGVDVLGLHSQGDDPAFLLHSAHCQGTGIHPKTVWHNPCPAELYQHALLFEPGTCLSSNGALITSSGSKTGRSPSDKRVVREPVFEQHVWWGPGANLPMDTRTFLATRQAAVDFLNMQDRLYVIDGFAGWDPTCHMRVRVITSSARHALIFQNMLAHSSPEEPVRFDEPDFVVYHAGDMPANKYESYMSSSTSICTSLIHKQMVILGTQYAGEMKKGIWTLMHYHLPVPDVLFLHSSANIGHEGDVTLFFGLSGTGKTTLSFDPHRALIGDDEHCWGPHGVFNIEGGCYAKVINLKPDSPPGIYEAIRFGAVLENVVYNPVTRQVDFDDASVTENIRASFPIHHVRNVHLPCVSVHPKNIIMLSCDAFGVLPPVSRLNLHQALYHFISGYTAKVAGTEQGVDEPQATFSACFAGAFLLWHPLRYTALLADKVQQHGTQAWLVNTGWAGGHCCGSSGHRISLQHTRAIIAAIHSGELLAAEYTETPIFHLQVPTSCPGVPATLLQPELQWQDAPAYQATLASLAEMFEANFDSIRASISTCDRGTKAVLTPELLQLIAAGGPSSKQLQQQQQQQQQQAVEWSSSPDHAAAAPVHAAAVTAIVKGKHCQPPSAAMEPAGAVAAGELAGGRVAMSSSSVGATAGAWEQQLLPAPAAAGANSNSSSSSDGANRSAACCMGTDKHGGSALEGFDGSGRYDGSPMYHMHRSSSGISSSHAATVSGAPGSNNSSCGALCTLSSSPQLEGYSQSAACEDEFDMFL